MDHKRDKIMVDKAEVFEAQKELIEVLLNKCAELEESFGCFPVSIEEFIPEINEIDLKIKLLRGKIAGTIDNKVSFQDYKWSLENPNDSDD